MLTVVAIWSGIERTHATDSMFYEQVRRCARFRFTKCCAKNSKQDNVLYNFKFR